MKKKLLIVLLAILSVVACVFGLAACSTKLGDNGGDQGTVQPTPDDTQKPSTVAVESVSLNKTTLSLEVDGVETLIATVTPNNATNKKVTWKSSDSAVAKVEDGKVTALKAGTATITATAGSKSASCEVKVTEKDLISFKTLEVDGDTIYGKVSNATGDFSFITEVTANGGATYTVATDKACNNVIPSKTVDLQEGDNVFYILVKRVNEIKLFTVTLRRRPIYTVTFDTVGGTAVVAQQVEEDGFAQTQQTSRTGYTFAGWSYNFSKPILKNETVTASWTANTYKISFDVNGGDELVKDKIAITCDDRVALPVPTSKFGVFDGWYYNGTKLTNENGVLLEKWAIAEDVTLISSWKTIFTFSNGVITGLKDLAKNFTEIEIPSEINGEKITAIGKQAFASYSELTSVIIPDSVTSIGYYAFRNCASLETVYWNATDCKRLSSSEDYGFSTCKLKNVIIGENVKTMPVFAFENCTRLTSITLPDSLASIGTSAFRGCSGLASLTLGNGVTSIGTSAFESCSSLTSIIIPDSVTNINEYAFRYCKGLTDVTVLGNGKANIGNYAFGGCIGLTELKIGSGVTSIDYGAFNNCYSLTSISIPDSVTSVSSGAFDGCKLEEITVSVDNTNYKSENNCLLTKDGNTLIFGCKTSIIPDGVTSIGAGAFNYCELTSITIPNGVTSIGNSAFEYCGGLISITIPDSVTSIGQFALSSCRQLTKINYGGRDYQWNRISMGVYWNYSTGNYTIYCTNGEIKKS